MKKRLVCLIGFVMLFMSVGCSNQTKSAYLRITPIDPFAGDNKIYQHFLGHQTGAFKLNYFGTKKQIKVTIAIWENGKKKEEIYSLWEYTEEDRDSSRFYDGQMIVSIKEPHESNFYEITAAFANETGSSSSWVAFPKEKESKASMILQLSNAIEIGEDEEVRIWGFQASEDGVFRAADLSDEGMKNTKWAMVVSLSLLD